MGCCLTVIAVGVCVVLLIFIFKVFLKLTTGWDRSPTCLVGKTAIVTGANSGIGFYTAQDFAKRGARVILAYRDEKRGEDARQKIVDATGNPNILVKILDLGSLESVRRFANEINETEERLDILVNNAGVGGFEHQLTADGLSLTMQTNHFGPFLLTHLLIGILKKSGSARIVNVSSDAAHFASLNMSDLNAAPAGFFSKTTDYCNTKLCNILFTNELARKLKGSEVETFSLHPGAVQTEFFKNIPQPYRRMFQAVAKLFYKTTEEGAQTSIYASVAKEISGKSGLYLVDCKKGRMPRSAKNEESAQKLWEKSVEFVKLTADERQLL